MNGVSANFKVSKYFFFVSLYLTNRAFRDSLGLQFGLKHCCSLDSNDDNNNDNSSDDNNGHNDNFLSWNVSGGRVIIKTGYALVNIFCNSPCCKGGAAGQFSHSFHCYEERKIDPDQKNILLFFLTAYYVTILVKRYCVTKCF